MKRRDLLKYAAMAAGGSVLFAGCKQDTSSEKGANVSVRSDKNEFKIVPMQTRTYNISTALLFHYPAIDELAKCNEKYKKVKVKTLYNSIPWPLASNYNEWMTLCRGGRNPDIKSFKDFAKYVKYAMDKGFEVCYLMNSPKAFNDLDLAKFKGSFYKLLDDIYDVGIKKVKFANTQVAQLINEHNPNFQLVSSTILEYHSIIQYEGLFEQFPNITQIGMTKDENQNFKLIDALRKTFPETDIEMMVDEGCLKGCFSRMSCMASSYNTYYKLGCRQTQRDRKLTFYKNGEIHPWDMGYYSALGVNSFKLVPMQQRASDKIQPHVLDYLDIAEYGADSERYRDYIVNHVPVNNIVKLSNKEILKYFPDMEYFVKNGDKCSTKCGVECRYCENRARELRELESRLMA